MPFPLCYISCTLQLLYLWQGSWTVTVIITKNQSTDVSRKTSLVVMRRSVLSNLVQGAGSLSQRTKEIPADLELTLWQKKTEE